MPNPLIAALLATTLTATAAMAQSSPPATQPGSTPTAPAPGRGLDTGVGNLPVGQVLSEEEIRERLRQDGYSEITEIKHQGPSYVAKAVKDGRTLNLTVDAATGSVRSAY